METPTQEQPWEPHWEGYTAEFWGEERLDTALGAMATEPPASAAHGAHEEKAGRPLAPNLCSPEPRLRPCLEKGSLQM